MDLAHTRTDGQLAILQQLHSMLAPSYRHVRTAQHSTPFHVACQAVVKHHDCSGKSPPPNQTMAAVRIVAAVLAVLTIVASTMLAKSQARVLRTSTGNVSTLWAHVHVAIDPPAVNCGALCHSVLAAAVEQALQSCMHRGTASTSTAMHSLLCPSIDIFMITLQEPGPPDVGEASSAISRSRRLHAVPPVCAPSHPHSEQLLLIYGM